MMTWIRCYWDEEDVWFYFEVDDAGQVTRQIELQGPRQTPVAAASLAEWLGAQATGQLADYESEFGLTAQIPISEWEGHSPEALTATAFEHAWAAARQTIAFQRT
ncbi:hypothetical protein AB0903_14715 [Streptomyces sp. NPDC048389]|uniref:hypothetical protein n=1 Tax=Streptomyces sp. NPDC048389 TaxID=3154622 RepID=UPI003453CFB4